MLYNIILYYKILKYLAANSSMIVFSNFVSPHAINFKFCRPLKYFASPETISADAHVLTFLVLFGEVR